MKLVDELCGLKGMSDPYLWLYGGADLLVLFDSDSDTRAMSLREFLRELFQ